jgi:adenosine kinase
VFFPDEFKNHILPEYLHKINVSFTVTDKRSSWGGTGGNIMYNAMQFYAHKTELSRDTIVLISALGVDGGPYLRHLQNMGVNTKYIFQDPVLESATCHIITDRTNSNQINYYFKGPTDMAGSISIAETMKDFKEVQWLAIVSPSTKDLMLKQLEECYLLKIESFFDPGQQITSFDMEDLRLAIRYSSFVFGNDYEIHLLEEHSGWNKADIFGMRKTIVTTLGKEGSFIENERIGKIYVPACKDIEAVDPTGAGDAFRAGFLVAYEKGCNLEICAQIGSVAASFAVQKNGTQTHHFTLEEFMERYETNYCASEAAQLVMVKKILYQVCK